MSFSFPLPKFTIGMGDRFGHQGEAQLRAVVEANKQGISISPVWNKSNREHKLVGTHPKSLREEADAAVAALGWKGSWFVDADHINLDTVDSFIPHSNFFTLDVAQAINGPASREACERFANLIDQIPLELSIPGIEEPVSVGDQLRRAAKGKFLGAIEEAGRIYRHILAAKGSDPFVVEVSIDETDEPQTPSEMLMILAMLAAEGIPAQTVAPKFTGRFNKGINYVGNLEIFEKEFDADLATIAFAIETFDLHPGLKLSVHSGSDKFVLYPIINRLIKKHGCGLHLKTAGTTWLEEVIGLAEAGGEALGLVKDIYANALDHLEELVAPYATVLDLDPRALPTVEVARGWDAETFANSLRHDLSSDLYNRHFRQLFHVAFKLAAKEGERFTEALKTHREIIAGNVTHNLLNQHLIPVFGD